MTDQGINDDQVLSWDDMKKFDNVPIVPSQQTQLTQQMPQKSQKENNSDCQITNWDDMKKFDNVSVQPKENKDVNLPFEVNDWADIKQYDDDHDNEWFKFEEKKLAEQFGEGVISVKYTNQGNVGYFCTICLAECNSKKTLDFHCSGMKHLKKKNIKEKGDGDGKSDQQEPKASEVPATHPPKPPAPNKPKKENKRFGYGMGNAPIGPPAFSNESAYRQYGRGSNPKPQYKKRSRSRSPRSHRSRYSRSPPVFRSRAFRSRSRSPSPLHIRPRYDSREPPSRREPSKRQPTPSPPPVQKVPLYESPTGRLLQKLAECSVKREQDVELGLNVVCSLTKSLREYFFKHDDSKVTEVMMEAELKLRTVKTLRAGLKMIADMTQKSSSPLPLPSQEAPVGYMSTKSTGTTEIPGYMSTKSTTERPRTVDYEDYDDHLGAPPKRTTAYDDYHGAPPKRTTSYDDYQGAPSKRTTSYDDYQGALPKRTTSYDDYQGAPPKRTTVFDERLNSLPQQPRSSTFENLKTWTPSYKSTKQPTMGGMDEPPNEQYDEVMQEMEEPPNNFSGANPHYMNRRPNAGVISRGPMMYGEQNDWNRGRQGWSPETEEITELWPCPDSDDEETSFSLKEFENVLTMASGIRPDVKKSPQEKQTQFPWNLGEDTTDFAWKTFKQAQKLGPKHMFPSKQAIDMERISVHSVKHPEASKFFKQEKIIPQVRAHIKTANPAWYLDAPLVKSDSMARGAAGASLMLLDIVRMLAEVVERHIKVERTQQKMTSFKKFATALAETVAEGAIFKAARHRERLRFLVIPSSGQWEHSVLLDSPIPDNMLFAKSKINEVFTKLGREALKLMERRPKFVAKKKLTTKEEVEKTAKGQPTKKKVKNTAKGQPTKKKVEKTAKGQPTNKEVEKTAKGQPTKEEVEKTTEGQPIIPQPPQQSFYSKKRPANFQQTGKNRKKRSRPSALRKKKET